MHKIPKYEIPPRGLYNLDQFKSPGLFSEEEKGNKGWVTEFAKFNGLNWDAFMGGVKGGENSSLTSFNKNSKALDQGFNINADWKASEYSAAPEAPAASTTSITPSAAESSVKKEGEGDVSGNKTGGSAFMGKLGAFGRQAAGSAPALAEIGIQALGGREATLQGAGDQAFNQFTSVAWKTSLKTGNPWLIAGAGVLKGVDFLNRYGGKTANTQGTDADLSVTGYNKQLIAGSNAKATLFGEMFKKKGEKRIDGINNQIKFAERNNMLANKVTYGNTANELAAMNTYGDKVTKNAQKLRGGMGTGLIAARQGMKVKPNSFVNVKNKAKRNVKKVQMNVIPEGALHARKNNYTGDLGDQVTHKGIPVITYEEGDKIKQHAEIEHSEIIFNKDISVKLDALFEKHKKASDKDKKELEIRVGKLLTTEILENTTDNVGLLDT